LAEEEPVYWRLFAAPCQTYATNPDPGGPNGVMWAVIMMPVNPANGQPKTSGYNQHYSAVTWTEDCRAMSATITIYCPLDDVGATAYWTITVTGDIGL
jgi:hypothetical protein